MTYKEIQLGVSSILLDFAHLQENTTKGIYISRDRNNRLICVLFIRRLFLSEELWRKPAYVTDLIVRSLEFSFLVWTRCAIHEVGSAEIR